MRIYLDDDSVAELLTKLLRRAGHEVRLPEDVELAGVADPIHFAHAIRENHLLLTRNYDDYRDLHHLILAAGGRRPGLLVVRGDNDPTRDMTTRGVVTAIANLVRSAVPLSNGLHVLNHWR